jgi:LysR family transcriptional regulator, glycine cleavage system transcriptional activator
MNEALPPLNAIRAFEAAARHLSFKEAAAELGVTNGAVSLQIKNLEGALGARLFDRHARSVALTSDGQSYFRSVRTAFRILKDATRGFRAADKSIMTVSCTPLFASQWLMPRLGSFQRREPGVDVRISTANRLIDFARDHVDIAIRHGLGRYPGLFSEMLIDDDLIVVCSPHLIGKGARKIRVAEDLRQFAFLHDEHDDDWQLWLSAAGVKDADWPAGPIFHDGKAVIEAAVAGDGLALIRESMVRHELRNGGLVCPLPARLKVDLAYYLVYPLGALDRREVATFREWLLEQARLDRTTTRGVAWGT